jgi:acyl-CoA reductase-like NAD-dependent aldehyde dehydrogenase
MKDIQKVVKEARESCVKAKPIKTRKNQLHALYDFLVKEENGLAEAVYKDLKKCKSELMFTELLLVKNDIVTALSNIDKWTLPTRAQKPLVAILDTCETRRVPWGLVLIIGTWNYPVLLTLGPLVSAIAGGNAAVIKFSEISAHTSNFLALNLPKYLDNNLYKFVLGEIPETTALLEQKFDLIFYTGNSFVARVVMTAAAKNLTPTVLELGGKSPVIVDKETDPVIAAKRVIWGKTINAGQTCIAPDYVLVHKDVAKEFISNLKPSLDSLLGDDLQKSKYYGRMSSDKHFDRLMDMLNKQLKVSGTKLLFGGESSKNERFIGITVLTGVGLDPKTNPVMADEIFGPILPVIVVDNIDEAIEYIQTRFYIFDIDQNHYPFTHFPKITKHFNT